MGGTTGGGTSPDRGSRRSALGRGLGSLIGVQSAGSAGQLGRRILEVPIEQIEPRHDQPRRSFDEEGIKELAVSIREKGILSPLLVRRQEQGYGLIAGERRWRAAQRAGLKTIPVVLEDADDDEAFEMALVENIQREDLNPLEEAEAFERLMTRRGWTQEQLGEHIGKDRSTIANATRLLKLPQAVREAVADGRLAMGHARALAALTRNEDIEKAAREIISKGLSVRRTEGLVRSIKKPSKRESTAASQKTQESPEIRDLISRIERSLATRCRLDHKQGRGSGRLTIEYESLDDLDRIIGRILGN